MINKVYFPRLILPVAALFPGLIDFAVASGILALGMAVYEIVPPLSALVLVPAIVLGTALLSLGIGMGLGALNVRFRDVNNGIAFLLQMWMFATPVVYPASLISENYRWMAGFNPMVGYVEAFRSALFGKPFDWTLLSMSLGATAICLVIGTRYFVRVEKNFADIV